MHSGNWCPLRRTADAPGAGPSRSDTPSGSQSQEFITKTLVGKHTNEKGEDQRERGREGRKEIRNER